VEVHEFRVRRGELNPTAQQWREIRAELTAWYPGCHLESEVVAGEMGPFGIRIARQVNIRLVDGPVSRATASGLIHRALDKIGRADMLEAEPAGE
jgi:hypothetical protein